MHIKSNDLRSRSGRRNAGVKCGFTLLEVMVALALMSVLLAVIMVPLNLGVNLTQIGSARADTQQAAQTTMNRIVSELRRATFVFPNARLAGVTDQAPYTNNGGYPYYRSSSGTDGYCGSLPGVVQPFENTSRLEILVPESRSGGDARSIVTFYTRRDNTAGVWNDPLFDSTISSIGIYRAQMPFRTRDNNPYLVGTLPNALVNSDRYPAAATCASRPNATNRGTRWLMHNGAGEPQLAAPTGAPLDPPPPYPANNDDLDGTPPGTDATQPASDVRIAPLGVNLFAPRAAATADTNLANNKRSFKPETTFMCEDTNGNGVIDRVTVTLVMGKFDGAGAENRAQTVRLTQAVDLPNVESRFGQSP